MDFHSDTLGKRRVDEWVDLGCANLDKASLEILTNFYRHFARRYSKVERGLCVIGNARGCFQSSRLSVLREILAGMLFESKPDNILVE